MESVYSFQVKLAWLFGFNDSWEFTKMKLSS